MTANECFEIKVSLPENTNFYSGRKITIDIKFINQTLENIFLKDVIIFYECHCSINLLHLKRFHKKNDTEKILSKYNKLFNGYSKENKYENDNFLMLKTEQLLFENKVLCAKDDYEISDKISIPNEAVSTYKSKYIHFYSVIRVKANLMNYAIPIKEIELPIKVKKCDIKETTNSLGSDVEDSQLNNPFEIMENDSIDCLQNDFTSRLILDKQASSRYKVTYQNSILCYLALLRPQIYVGDAVRLVLNFAPDSPITCIRFSVTLKSTEKLLIPVENDQEEPFELSLSSKEFGPYFHECMCIDVYPIIIYIPNEQYPSLNFDIFKLVWSLELKFMIADSKDVSIDINEMPQKESISRSGKKEIKAELLKWELPIHVKGQRI